MSRRYQVISADGHLETPPDGWLRHVPSAYRDLAPRLVRLPEGGEAWIVEGLPMIHNGQNLAAGRTVKLSSRCVVSCLPTMWGSDFPHSVTSFPRSRDWLQTIFEGVPEELRCRILLENPCRFFGLDPDRAVTPTPG